LPGEDLSLPAVAQTLAGAVGPVARTVGLAADHVLAIDLVTPDGAARTVTPETDPDLFCTLRGGAAGLGVVTGSLLGALALAAIRAGTWWFSPATAAETAAVLHRWHGWLDGLPETMSTRAVLTATDDGLALSLRFAHLGDPVDGAALLTELADEL